MKHILADYANGFVTTGSAREDMVTFLSQHGCTHTIGHSMRVAAEACRLAAQFGADPDSAELCGWYHDISAVIPNAERIAVADALSIDVLPEERTAPMIIHQKLSAEMARDIFHISDPTILSAIGCHTTLKAGASLLDKVVFVADKIAWDQPGDPPYLEAIVAAVDQSIDAAALCYLSYLWEMREQLLVIHPWFVAAYEELKPT
jgi:predicted HD superfamily hydrolase involved in NAD metabolism